MLLLEMVKFYVHRESNVFLLLYVVIRGVRFDIVGCHALIVKIIG